MEYYIQTEEDAIEEVREKQRRMDWDYYMAGKRWGGNTCSPGRAQIYWDGKIYVGTSKYETTTLSVSIHEPS